MTLTHQDRHSRRTLPLAHRQARSAALASLVLVACSPNHWAPPAPPPPVIGAFTASPATIARGGTATLSWSVSTAGWGR